MILQTLLCKIKKICIFFQKNLHISKKSSTFAPDLENKIYKQLKIKQL